MRLDDAHKLAYDLLQQHLPGSDWDFTFFRSTTRAGECDFETGLIKMSTHFVLVYDEYAVEQIILHEIGHALAGPNKGHGSEWRKYARSIGYEGGATIKPLRKTGTPAWKILLGALALCHGVGVIAGVTVGWGLSGLVVAAGAIYAWSTYGPIPSKYTAPDKRRS